MRKRGISAFAQRPDHASEKASDKDARAGTSGEQDLGLEERAAQPRHWQVDFQDGGDLERYARELDFFGIEIGVVGGITPNGGGRNVEYAYHLASAKPDRREGRQSSERRYWLRWTPPGVEEADRKLAEKSGLNPNTGRLLKFVPHETELKLLKAEEALAGPRVNRIVRTRFGVKKAGDGYEFYVIEQTYR